MTKKLHLRSIPGIILIAAGSSYDGLGINTFFTLAGLTLMIWYVALGQVYYEDYQKLRKKEDLED